MRLSVVVPVLNDMAALRELCSDLAACELAEDTEVLVVDGGSDDGSQDVARQAGYTVLSASPSRGGQLNRGAAAAQGEVIWFLHSDSRVQPALPTIVAGQTAACGRLRLKFDDPHWLMRCIARLMEVRSSWTGICTGDQGIWVQRRVLQRIGGVPDQPLMEDVELCKRLKKVSPPWVIPSVLVSSARRWQRKGRFRTIGLMWWYRWQYWRGASAAALAKAYYGEPT